MTSPQAGDTNSTDAIRITTGSRLHFGLIDVAAPFGGVGLMIDRPNTEIRISPAESFSCVGDGSQRGIEITQRLADFLEHPELPGCQLEIVHRPTSHTGLGTGTQLAMAVAEGLAEFCSAKLSDESLALQIADRGKRSAIGTHGYWHGGLIYEASQDASRLNAIQERVELPTDWCVAIFCPANQSPTVSGSAEQQQFAQLDAISDQRRGQLLDIISTQLVPAAKAKQFAEFSEAVHRYNYASGMLFGDAQGGPYNGPQVSNLIEHLISQGATGVGQSSWGPSVFAWFESRSAAQTFADRVSDQVGDTILAHPLNTPRTFVS